MVKKTIFSGGVSFGGVSIGEKTARIGIRVDRGVMELNQADEYFCDRRLSGKVVLGRFDESTGQRKLVDDVDHEVASTFDVKGFRCSTDFITTGLTFSLNDIDITELARFSKGEGRLVINDVAEIPEEEKGERTTPDHVPGTLKADGPWKDYPLDKLFDPAKTVRKSLAEANINTVGDLANFTATPNKRLTDINGIGPGKAQEIEDTMMNFWADNKDAQK